MTNFRLLIWNVGDNSALSTRIPRIIDGVVKQRPSLLAFQEYGSNEYPRIYREIGGKLGKFDYHKAGNRHVAWRSSKWRVLNKQKITLKPDRQVPAVLLESRSTGARLWLYSVHLTHKAENARLRIDQTKALLGFFDALKRIADVPIVGGGDINSVGTVKDQGDVRDLVRVDDYRTLIDLSGHAPATHRGTRRLDEAILSRDVALREAILHWDPTASDHAAILARLAIPTPSKS